MKNNKSFKNTLAERRNLSKKLQGFHSDRALHYDYSSLMDSKVDLHVSSPKLNLSKVKLPTMKFKDIGRVKNIVERSAEDPLVSLFSTLSALFKKKSIPTDLFGVLTGCIEKLPKQKAIIMAQHEIESLKEGESLTFQVSKSVKSREDSLKSINDLNDYLKSTDWVQFKDVHIQCAELLHAHRLLTINAIDCILNWKKNLENSLVVNGIDRGFIECRVRGENYLMKIRNDLDFLKNSEFSKVFSIGEADPLLVKPSLGKREKGKKRENYFTENGKAVVPIPCFIAGKVKEYEDVVKNEWEARDCFLRESAEKIAIQEVRDKLVEEEVLARVLDVYKEVIKDIEKLGVRVLRDLIEDYVLNEIGVVVGYEMRDYEENQIVADESKIFSQVNLLPNQDVSEIRPNTSSTVDLAQDLEIFQIIVGLSVDISLSLIEGFVPETVKEIVSEVINEINLGQEIEFESSQAKQCFSYAKLEDIEDLNNTQWVPLNISEDLISSTLFEYYSILPHEILSIIPDIKCLLSESRKYADPCWFWAVNNAKIIGFLSFSFDCFSISGKTLIVHHVSCLFWQIFSKVLESCKNFLWSKTGCDEIRVNLFIPIGQELSVATKKIFTQQKFRWKTKEPASKDYEIVILGIRKDSNPPDDKQFDISIKCFEAITCENLKIPVSHNRSHLKTVANRLNMIHALLGLHQIDDFLLNITEKYENKLQENMKNLLGLVKNFEIYSFPFISKYSPGVYLGNYLENCLDFKELKNCSVSVLDLGFKWVSCSTQSLKIKGKTVKFLRFKSDGLMFKSLENGIELFQLNTSIANVKAVIFKGESLNDCLEKTVLEGLDLFCCVEKLRKDMQNVEGEVWMPFFNIKSCEKIEWMTGYEIISQDSSGLLVKNCVEGVSLEMKLKNKPEGNLKVSKNTGKVLDGNFVFGLIHLKEDNVLDVPLFSCLVKEENWVLD